MLMLFKDVPSKLIKIVLAECDGISNPEYFAMYVDEYCDLTDEVMSSLDKYLIYSVPTTRQA